MPTVNVYEHVDPSDFLTFLPPEYRSAKRPLLVFLTTSAGDDAAKAADEVEARVFGDESVAIGAKLFQAIHLNGDKISKAHPHWPTLGGKSLPRAIVVDANGQRSATLEGGELKGSGLFKAMRKAAARTYAQDLEKFVKASRELLDELDKLEARQEQLAAKFKDAKPAEQKAIAGEQLAVAEQLAAARERQTKLVRDAQEERAVAKG